MGPKVKGVDCREWEELASSVEPEVITHSNRTRKIEGFDRQN